MYNLQAFTESNYWPFGVVFFTVALFFFIKNGSKLDKQTAFFSIIGLVMLHPVIAFIGVVGSLRARFPGVLAKKAKKTGMTENEVILFSNFQLFFSVGWLMFLYLTYGVI